MRAELGAIAYECRHELVGAPAIGRTWLCCPLTRDRSLHRSTTEGSFAIATRARQSILVFRRRNRRSADGDGFAEDSAATGHIQNLDRATCGHRNAYRRGDPSESRRCRVYERLAARAVFQVRQVSRVNVAPDDSESASRLRSPPLRSKSSWRRNSGNVYF